MKKPRDRAVRDLDRLRPSSSYRASGNPLGEGARSTHGTNVAPSSINGRSPWLGPAPVVSRTRRVYPGSPRSCRAPTRPPARVGPWSRASAHRVVAVRRCHSVYPVQQIDRLSLPSPGQTSVWARVHPRPRSRRDGFRCGLGICGQHLVANRPFVAPSARFAPAPWPHGPLVRRVRGRPEPGAGSRGVGHARRAWFPRIRDPNAVAIGQPVAPTGRKNGRALRSHEPEGDGHDNDDGRSRERDEPAPGHRAMGRRRRSARWPSDCSSRGRYTSRRSWLPSRTPAPAGR